MSKSIFYARQQITILRRISNQRITFNINTIINYDYLYHTHTINFKTRQQITIPGLFSNQTITINALAAALAIAGLLLREFFFQLFSKLPSIVLVKKRFSLNIKRKSQFFFIILKFSTSGHLTFSRCFHLNAVRSQCSEMMRIGGSIEASQCCARNEEVARRKYEIGS